jgi:predicted lipoprotein
MNITTTPSKITKNYGNAGVLINNRNGGMCALRAKSMREKEVNMKKRLLVLLMATAISVSSMTGCMKIVKIGEEGKYTGEVEFNAGDNVADIWDSAALPELTGKAVDLSTFLGEANGDLKSLADKYGKYSMGTSGELNYTVKGTAVVKEVNTEKKAGYMVISVDGYTGPIVIQLQVGPVFKGTAVRDSLNIIKFEDYKNQVDYAAVSQSIHNIIKTTIIDKIDLASIEGKQIEFTGCFTADKEDQILITPVALTVK